MTQINYQIIVNHEKNLGYYIKLLAGNKKYNVTKKLTDDKTEYTIDEINRPQTYQSFSDIDDQLTKRAKKLNINTPSTIKNVTVQIFNAQEAEEILYSFPIKIIKSNDNKRSFSISIDIPLVNNKMVADCIEQYLIMRINRLMIDSGLYDEIGETFFDQVIKECH